MVFVTTQLKRKHTRHRINEDYASYCEVDLKGSSSETRHKIDD